MCLILFAINPIDELKLVVAANRDEFYVRPAQVAGFWPDHSDLLAGRDQEAGGTWLGVSKNGRFAAVTNFREPQPPGGDGAGNKKVGDGAGNKKVGDGAGNKKVGDGAGDKPGGTGAGNDKPGSEERERSRGELSTGFLLSSDTPEAYMAQIQGGQYKGFNLLAFDGKTFGYFCNSRIEGTPESRLLEDGCYGVSNQALDCNWPKVEMGRDTLQAHFQARKQSAGSGNLWDDQEREALTQTLFDLLTSEGDGREYSNSFIRSDVYGTRAATVVIMQADGTLWFEERTFKAGGEPGGVMKLVIRP